MPEFISIYLTDIKEKEEIKAAASQLNTSVSNYLFNCHKFYQEQKKKRMSA